MTVATRRPRACVRCAAAPRHDETFLCGACLADPSTHAEAEMAFRASDRPRLWLIQRMGWRGGWSRDETATAA